MAMQHLLPAQRGPRPLLLPPRRGGPTARSRLPPRAEPGDRRVHRPQRVHGPSSPAAHVLLCHRRQRREREERHARRRRQGHLRLVGFAPGKSPHAGGIPYVRRLGTLLQPQERTVESPDARGRRPRGALRPSPRRPPREPAGIQGRRGRLPRKFAHHVRRHDRGAGVPGTRAQGGLHREQAHWRENVRLPERPPDAGRRGPGAPRERGNHGHARRDQAAQARDEVVQRHGRGIQPRADLRGHVPLSQSVCRRRVVGRPPPHHGGDAAHVSRL
mmetsp:Transcript_6979/g.17294  ORF Transcript_6979/g.17294 Transcript_6979/m.17294 type:complete len:273 (+) Transcript_6979:349-1167(+)